MPHFDRIGIPNFSGAMGDPFEDRLNVLQEQESLEDGEEDGEESFGEDVYDPYHDLDLGMPND